MYLLLLFVMVFRLLIKEVDGEIFIIMLMCKFFLNYLDLDILILLGKVNIIFFEKVYINIDLIC